MKFNKGIKWIKTSFRNFKYDILAGKERAKNRQKGEQDDKVSTSQISVVPDQVKYSRFGCVNCLWAGVECKDGSQYKTDGKLARCTSYNFYD